MEQALAVGSTLRHEGTEERTKRSGTDGGPHSEARRDGGTERTLTVDSTLSTEERSGR